ADVVVCSCIGAGGEQLAAASEQCEETGAAAGLTFSTVLIDEATQATEPASLVPLTRGCEQLILVGDQNQLPPTILSRGAAAGGLATSLFARLMLAGVAPVVLARQYRMHPRIAAFPGARFYGGRLASAPRAVDRPTPRGFPWPNAAVPVAFVAVRDDSDGARGLEARGSGGATAEDGGGGATSWCNAREAAAACAVVRALLRGGGGGGDVAPQDVGVITPYAAQVRRGGGRKRTAAPPRAPQPWELIEVRSVDGYQGREKEVIVLSAVRSNRCGAVGFLSDWRRLNVAITRARRGVVIVGDPATLSHDAHWRAYIAWCAENGALMTERDLRRALQQQQQPGGSGDAQQ
ncbi:AAA domain-containing protein, partial [Tribonema minus]